MHLKTAADLVARYGMAMVQAPAGGISAVAVGRKGGGPISGATDFALSLFVPRKLSTAELGAAGTLPVRSLLQSIDPSAAVGVGSDELDVVESGTMFFPKHSYGTPLGLRVPALLHGIYGGTPAVANTQKWFASIRPGISITNSVGEYPTSLSVGTLGFCLRDDMGVPYLVSNNHVIAKSNAATLHDPIVQPGTLDLTAGELASMPTLATLTTAFQIARLTAFQPLQWITPSNIPVNTVDAALAELISSGRGVGDLDRLCYAGGIRGVAAPYQLDPSTAGLQGSSRVFKVGRTTGFTEGVVTHILGTATIQYPGGAAYFSNQIVVQATRDNVGPFSGQGDSGSAVLNDRNEVVGLLFGGSFLQTLVNPIEEVLVALRAAAAIPSLQVITV